MAIDQIAWFPLCVGATVAGLVLSFLAFRRRGAAAGLRMTAWALLPLAAYLTGALAMLWTIGSTVVGFVTSLVFSPLVWAGVAVAGLSVVLFVASGVMRGRKLARAGGGRKKESAPEAPAATRRQAPAARPAAAEPAVAAKKSPAADDDMSDIEDILKKHGIN